MKRITIRLDAKAESILAYFKEKRHENYSSFIKRAVHKMGDDFKNFKQNLQSPQSQDGVDVTTAEETSIE